MLAGRLAAPAIPAANHPSRADNLSYIEHIFEISRRPDLLTRVVEYRTTVLKISEDDEIDTKLTRIPSAKKYKGTAGGRLVRGPQASNRRFLPLKLSHQVFPPQASGFIRRHSKLRGNLAEIELEARQTDNRTVIKGACLLSVGTIGA